MTTRVRKATDWQQTVDKIHLCSSSGTVSKLFEDDYFIFELIKLLYEETIEIRIKIDLLTTIEQFGSEALHKNSVDQVITALLDVFREIVNNPNAIPMALQLLLTVTTVFIDHEELWDTQLCSTFMSQLTEIISKVNNSGTRRLRACCCHCLAELETWKPGILGRLRDTLNRLMREEKSDVCQDYMQLLISVFNNQAMKETEGSLIVTASSDTQMVVRERMYSLDGKDLLPIVSQVMENVFLLTPSGLSNIMCSIVNLVKTCRDISPSIFKPLMLQCMMSLDPVIICLMLYIQREFRGEILSNKEERLLLQRVLSCVNHPGLGLPTRLAVVQWLKSYLEQEELVPVVSELNLDIEPFVFEPLELHTTKLALQIHCMEEDSLKDIPSDSYCLLRVAETTGGMRVSRALYHIMYLYVSKSKSETVYSSVLSVTRELFQNFPHLIPLIVDFLHTVKISQPESKFPQDILGLLHDTVLSLPLASLLNNYQNYLQVWLLSSKDSNIFQQKPLRQMLKLVQLASLKAIDDWVMGSLILTICRIMILHHHTDILYTQMGNLLYYMMTDFGDTDIRDHARFYYALLTLCSDSKAKEILSAALVEGLTLGENISDFFPGSAHTVPAEIQELEKAPLSWERESLEVKYQFGEEKRIIEFDPVKDGLEDYWEKLLCLQTSLDCKLTARIIDETDLDLLVAVSFIVSENGNMNISKAPSDVSFTFIPIVPEPVAVKVRVLFGHKRSTYECNLTPIKLKLSDLLLPFPWSIMDISDRQAFFNCLWNNYTNKSKGPSNGVESVKILHYRRQQLRDAWENAMISYVESAKTSSISEVDRDDFLFFMPPCFHLLFRLRVRDTDLVLHIASDYWPVLKYVDNYLENLCSINS